MKARSPIGAAAAVALGYLLLLAARTDALLPGHVNWAKPWDHQKYLFMAGHPLDLRLAPFSWRLAGPLLAGALPFSTSTSFRVVGFVAVWATAVAMFVLLRRLGMDGVLAGAGMLLFLSVGWATGYLLYNFWLPDGLAFLCVVVVAVAAVDRRPLLFAAVLVAGVLVKEQVLLAAPLWWSFGPDRRRFVEAGLLAAPAIAVLAAVRVLLPSGNEDAGYLAALPFGLNAYDALPSDPASLYEKFSPVREGYPWLVAEWSVQVFGTLLPLSLAAWQENLRALARWWPLAVLALAQPLLASNTHRLVVLAFPVVVVTATQGLGALRDRFGPWLLALPVALLALDVAAPRNTSRLLLETAVVAGAAAFAALAARNGRMHT